MAGGRPPIYNSVDEILPLLEEWERKISIGEETPTVTGLTLALNFESKDTLYAYRDKPEFSYSIKKALLIVENGYEKALRENHATGSIFALKNMGWIDKVNNDHTTNGKDIVVPPISWSNETTQ
jgi:hypothetical protein